MNALSPAVLDNGDVLRRFADARPIGSIAELAKEFGRDTSNFRRTVDRLREAGAISTPEAGGAPVVTAEGRRALQALDLAEGRITVPEGYVALHHAQILPDALNPRSDFDSEEHQDSLWELISDILQNGLLQNLLVRPSEPSDYFNLQIGGQDAPMFRLISGERRWRAIGVALHDGDWPADRLIPCQVIETDDIGHSLRALAENLQRRALSPMEEAKAFRRLVDRGMGTEELADRVSVTQRQVQMRLQLFDLPEAEQARMELPKDDPQHLTVTEARQLIQKPKMPVAPVPSAQPAVERGRMTPDEAETSTQHTSPASVQVHTEPKAPRKPLSQADRDVDMVDRFASRLKLRLIDRRASSGSPLIGPDALGLREAARLAVRAFHKADVDGLGVALAALCATPHFAMSPSQLLASAASDWEVEQADRLSGNDGSDTRDGG